MLGNASSAAVTRAHKSAGQSDTDRATKLVRLKATAQNIIMVMMTLLRQQGAHPLRKQCLPFDNRTKVVALSPSSSDYAST
jgi:hypothetical protein